MTSFSSLLSSISGPAQAPQQGSSNVPKPQPAQLARKLSGAGNLVRLVPNNVAAGVKRRSEEPEPGPRPKAAKIEQNVLSSRPAPPSRFQLSGKAGDSQKPPQRPALKSNTSSNLRKPAQNSASRGPAGATPTPPSTANGPPPSKRGFASIMERAKAAQEAAKASGPSGIKHKPVEKMTKRERLRVAEEAKAQQKAGKNGNVLHGNRSRSGTPVASKPGASKRGQEASYQGTMMKKRAEPLSYRGTMRAGGSGPAKDRDKQKGLGQGKYGGYASWSDLSDAEEEEPDYESEGLSDMEGGFDDVEEEEMMALRAAKKEDQEALAEEEKHRQEKLARKRRLEALSKSAAARKKY